MPGFTVMHLDYAAASYLYSKSIDGEDADVLAVAVVVLDEHGLSGISGADTALRQEQNFNVNP